MNDLHFYKMSELPARAVRSYILEDLRHPDGAHPVMVGVVRTMDFSDNGIDKKIATWLRDNETPVETFQIFPVTYHVFYDVADVLMLKLAVGFQD